VAGLGWVAMACSHNSSNSSSLPSTFGRVLNSASRTRSILTLKLSATSGLISRLLYPIFRINFPLLRRGRRLFVFVLLGRSP